MCVVVGERSDCCEYDYQHVTTITWRTSAHRTGLSTLHQHTTRGVAPLFVCWAPLAAPRCRPYFCVSRRCVRAERAFDCSGRAAGLRATYVLPLNIYRRSFGAFDSTRTLVRGTGAFARTLRPLGRTRSVCFLLRPLPDERFVLNDGAAETLHAAP